MNISEFFTNPSIQLPIVRNDDDFQGFIERVLDNFLEKLEHLELTNGVGDDLNNAKPQIIAFCTLAKEVIRSTFDGHPGDAYAHFHSAVNEILSFIQNQTLEGIGSNHLGRMYRVRRHASASLTKEELFHIPFDKRYLVSTQRYSVPGLPCLYLSGSLYTCWAEMGRPPFHELHAAAFWLKPEAAIKILNFSNRPARLLKYVQSGNIPTDPKIQRLIASHIVLWPLMAMCSIKVKHKDAPYKPEYIFPQMLLQWISKEHQFDGVCYFSTHVEPVTNHPFHTSNLVFPVRENKPKGRCGHLRELFKMTPPYGWQLLKAVRAGEGMTPMSPLTFNFEFLTGIEEPYYGTEFGNVQSKLDKLALDIIARNRNGEPILGEIPE